MSSNLRREFLEMFGIVESNEPCSICNKPIMQAGSPLPQPCSICGNDKYCLACSFGTQIGGVFKSYCSKHSYGEIFN